MFLERPIVPPEFKRVVAIAAQSLANRYPRRPPPWNLAPKQLKDAIEVGIVFFTDREAMEDHCAFYLDLRRGWQSVLHVALDDLGRWWRTGGEHGYEVRHYWNFIPERFVLSQKGAEKLAATAAIAPYDVQRVSDEAVHFAEALTTPPMTERVYDYIRLPWK